jgi:hypothetical protein
MHSVTQRIRPYLDLGEHVLWSGRPRQGIVFRDGDALLIPFGIFFGTAGISAIGKGGTADHKPILGAMAAAIGLYLVLVRFFLDAYHRSKLVYAITDRRAIMFDHSRRTSVTWVELKSLQNPQLIEYDKGHGTIHFGPIPAQHKLRMHAAMGEHPMFFQIENARKVYEILRKAMEGAR